MNQLFTPCIMQTIIICCTIIIIALVILSGYRISRQKEFSSEGYIFISSILAVLAIAIFSYAFYGNRTVLDFISLASALISIILAIITIIYSFYTNGRSVGQAEKLQEAAEKVQNATLSYSNSAESLQENIQKIIAAVYRVEAKTDKLLDNNNIGGSNGNNILSDFNLNKYIEGYVGTSSQIGIVAMYACIKSKDSEKTFPLSIFGSKDNGLYVSGFLIATVSSGLLFLDINFGKETVMVSQYIPQLKDAVFEKIEEYRSVDAVKIIIAEVDKYFSE